jgi:hypothetical protein
VICVYRKYSKYKTKYNEYSYMRNTSRIKKNSCLHDDIEDCIAKNGNNLNNLVDKLLKNHFEHSRFTDPEYPV